MPYFRHGQLSFILFPAILQMAVTNVSGSSGLQGPTKIKLYIYQDDFYTILKKAVVFQRNVPLFVTDNILFPKGS